MSYDVVVTDDPARQGVAVRIFQRRSNPVLISQTGVPRWDIVHEGEETTPTFVLPPEIAEQLARRLTDHLFPMGREDTGEHRYRVAYLEGEQSGMQRHLDHLRHIVSRMTNMAPEGPAVSVGGQVVNTTLDERAIGDNDGDLGPGGVDYWRRRALNAEATIRDALGETAPPRPPRRILDVEPAQNVPRSRSDDRIYTAGEEAR